MKISTKEFKFHSAPGKEEVTAIYDQPELAKSVLVLGHGSGSNIKHQLMSELSNALNHKSIATIRFNYPYSEKGKGGMDGEKVRLSTVRSALIDRLLISHPKKMKIYHSSQVVIP